MRKVHQVPGCLSGCCPQIGGYVPNTLWGYSQLAIPPCPNTGARIKLGVLHLQIHTSGQRKAPGTFFSHDWGAQARRVSTWDSARLLVSTGSPSFASISKQTTAIKRQHKLLVCFLEPHNLSTCGATKGYDFHLLSSYVKTSSSNIIDTSCCQRGNSKDYDFRTELPVQTKKKSLGCPYIN